MVRYVNEILEKLGVYVEKLRKLHTDSENVVKGYRPLILADVKDRQKKGKNGWVYDGNTLDMEVVGVKSPEVDPAWALNRYSADFLVATGAVSVSAAKLRDAKPSDSKEIDKHLLQPSERLKIDLKPKTDDEVRHFLEEIKKHYPKDPAK